MFGGGSGGFAGGGFAGGGGAGGTGGPIPQDLYNEMFPGQSPNAGFQNSGQSMPGATDQEVIAAVTGADQSPAPEAPSPLGDTTQQQDQAAANQRRARSRAATILTGANQAQGIGPGVGTISRRILLGS